MLGANAVATPMASTTSLTMTDGSVLSSSKFYRQIVSGLQYLLLTRPDVALSVNCLSQYMNKPTDIHWAAVKRILRYFKGTAHFGLSFNRNTPLALHAFSNANWAGNRDDSTSTIGYIIFLGNNPISWSSLKQRSVSHSSIEAEYSAVAHTTSEVCWLLSLLQEMQVSSTVTPTIYCDNLGTTYVCANPKLHSKMKHVRVDLHFVRDKVSNGSTLLLMFQEMTSWLTF